MQQVVTNQVVQLIAWIIALIEFTVGLYILLLNTRSQSNRHVSILLVLFSLNTFSQGLMLAATNLDQVQVVLSILAATTPAIQPGLLLIALVLLKPQWIQGRWRGFRWGMYIVIILPIIFTLLDMFFGTSLWFTGYATQGYVGGFINLPEYTQGLFGPFLRIAYIYLITIITIFPIAYITFFDKSTSSLTRKLAYTLLITQILAVAINFTIFAISTSYIAILVTSTLFAFGYSYAAFWQLISERRLQTGRLQVRLTVLILAITIPLVIAIPTILNNYPVSQAAAAIMISVGVVMLGTLTTLAIRQAIQPITTLTETVTAIANGDLNRVAPVESEDEIGILSEAFNQMTEQLIESIGSLDQRVSDRTKDLEERSSQLQAAADVGRAASSVLDVDQLIQEVVDVIQENFNLYYVGLFLVDNNKEWADLHAGTGEAGEVMLSRHHRIQIGHGMVGWCIAHGQSRIAMEVGGDEIRLATTELPLTRSEAAIPLRVRGRIIGAITVQDTKTDAFDDSSIAALQTMADLVSIAINNAQLYRESQDALSATQRAYGEMIGRGWSEQLQNAIGYRSTDQGVSFIEVDDPTPSDENKRITLSVPIKVRDMVVGQLITRKAPDAGEWTPDEKSMLDSITEQLGVALEASRLYQETQRKAVFERLSREVSTNIRNNLNLDTVLQTAASEFQRILSLSEVEIRMGLSDTNDTGQSIAAKAPLDEVN